MDEATSDIAPVADPQATRLAGRGLAAYLFAIAVALLALFYLAVSSGQLAPGGDNALYLILARALVTGEGLRLIHIPTAPLFIKWPPLWPLALAPLAAIAPAGIVWMKGLATLALLVALVPLYAALRAAYGAPIARLAVLLSLLSPPVFAYAHDVRPEMLYLLLSSAALAVVLSGEPDAPLGDGRAVGLGLLVGGAYLTRSIGIALAAAVLVALILAGRRRTAGMTLLGFALAAVPWHVYTLWARLQDPSLQGYSSDLLLRDAYNPALGRIDAGDLAARMAGAGWDHMRNLTNIVLAGSLKDMTGFSRQIELPLMLGMVIAAVYAADLALDFLARQHSAARVLPLYELFYWGILLVWPWTEVKFLVPIIPLVWARLLRRAHHLLIGDPKAAASSRPAEWRLALAAGILAALIFAQARGLADAAALERQAFLPSNWQRYQEAAEWVGAHSPSDAVVITRKPEVFYLRSGRPATWIPSTQGASIIRRRICGSGARYVVVDSLGFPGTSYLTQYMATHREFFKLAFRTPAPVTAVYAVDAHCGGGGS